MYIYIYVHMYIYVYIYIHIHICIHTNIHIHMHIYIYINTHFSTWHNVAWAAANKHTHTHIYIHTCIGIYIYIMYTYTHHMHINMYTYTHHIHIYIYTLYYYMRVIYNDLCGSDIVDVLPYSGSPCFFIDTILLSDVPSQNNTPPARSVCNFFPSTQACCVGPHIWLSAPQTLRVFGLVTAPQKELEDPPCLGRRIVQKFQGILRITSPDAQWHRGSVVHFLGPRLSNCGRGRVAALRMLWWSARINFGRTPCRCPVLAGWDGHENLLDHQNPHNGIKWVTFWYQTWLNMINDPTGWQETQPQLELLGTITLITLKINGGAVPGSMKLMVLACFAGHYFPLTGGQVSQISSPRDECCELVAVMDALTHQQWAINIGKLTGFNTQLF